MTEKVNLKRILLLSGIAVSIISLICIFGFLKAGVDRMQIGAGVLDLHNREPDENNVLSLSGRW